jgi:hypothetical protein
MVRVPVADLERRVVDELGKLYSVRVFGVEADDGLWDGYIEFVAADGEALVTPRETRQPNLPDLVYWATGVSAVYLEGALERALDREASELAAPEGELPAPRRVRRVRPAV